MQIARWLPAFGLKVQYFRGAVTGISIALPTCEASQFQERSMTDVILIIVTVVFFIIAWVCVRGCDHL